MEKVSLRVPLMREELECDPLEGRDRVKRDAAPAFQGHVCSFARKCILRELREFIEVSRAFLTQEVPDNPMREFPLFWEALQHGLEEQLESPCFSVCCI